MEHEITVMPFVSIIHHHPQRRANPTHTRLCVCPEQGANGGGQRGKNWSHTVTAEGQ